MLAQPVFAVPIANRFDCFAIALYGPHSSSNFSDDERATLARLAELAGDVGRNSIIKSLLRRIEALEVDRGSTAAGLATQDCFKRSQRSNW